MEKFEFQKIFIHSIWYVLETFIILLIFILLFVFLTRPLVNTVGVGGAAVTILLITSAVTLSINALLKKFYLTNSHLICDGENLQNYRRGKLVWSIPIKNIVAVDERQGLWRMLNTSLKTNPNSFIGFSLITLDDKHYYSPYLKNYDLFLQKIKQLNPNINLTNLTLKIAQGADWGNKKIEITKKQIFIAVGVLLGIIILLSIVTKI